MLQLRRGPWTAALAVGALLAVTACAPANDEEADTTPEIDTDFVRLDGITTANEYGDAFDEGLERWQEEIPNIQDVRITSTADDHEQPALWLPAPESGAPLLLVLHTWSTEYLQHIDIPLGQWAEQMGWAMIHPNFRGANDNPDATGSELAVQDVLDSVDFAAEEGAIDTDQVYVIGFSGGGYKALLMAGRHPDRFAAAVAWVPIHDLNEWYAHHVATDPEAHYIDHISSSCEGSPATDPAARESCAQRSPVTHLDGAREAGVPVYIGHGLSDPIVPPSHAALAFNQLADEADRLSDEEVEAIGNNELPGHLDGSIDTETYFGDDDPEALFARRSAAATFVLFEGEHDMVYHPGLEWIVNL
jgi:predicted esterase